MRSVLLTTLTVLLTVTVVTSSPSTSARMRCPDSVTAFNKEAEADCRSNEYTSYTECIRTKRLKRHADCYDDCGGDEDCGGSESECSSCNCNYCAYHECESRCDSCCSSAPAPCQSHTCCHSTCSNQCRSYDCRKRCRKVCSSKITPPASVIRQQSQEQSLHNVTTVINLHNVINNTNVIDMPVTVNNTNVNNITLEMPSAAAASTVLTHLPQQQQQPCCKIIEPRQCTPTTAYPFERCFHLRRQHCGSICQAQLMHAQPHRVCDEVVGQQPQCNQQVVYIPQPQPRCHATSSWPYVTCGVQAPNCDGCYGSATVQQSHCTKSCYGDAYGVGPIIRPGPFYSGGYPNVGGYAAPAYPAMGGYTGFGSGANGYLPMNAFGMNFGGGLPMFNPMDGMIGVQSLYNNNPDTLPQGSESITQVPEDAFRGGRAVDNLESQLSTDETTRHYEEKESSVSEESSQHTESE